MTNNTPASRRTIRGLGTDFWTFWVGQFISTLGTSFSSFAIPLIIYKITGSAVNLALATAAAMLPYLLFGLVIGAWADRLDRKRLMLVVNVLMAANIATIPLLSFTGHLSVWWIYGVGFIESTLGIFFRAAEFAAVPSLVGKDNLVTANGRIEASYQAAFVVGPLLAGACVVFFPVAGLLLVDAVSFVVAAAALLAVRVSFNASDETREKKSIRHDVVEGLRYVVGHPVLRNISLMMALVNFFGSTIGTQLVLFSKQALHATDSQLGLMFSAGSVGSVVILLGAGWLRKHWSFSQVALGCLMVDGALTVVFAYSHWLPVGAFLWALISGFGLLFNINTGSLRQAIVPNHLLGRILTIAGVLAWSAIPLGSFLGGIAIQRTGNVRLVYAVIGVVTFLIPVVFAFSPLGHADRYIPSEPEVVERDVAAEADLQPV